MNTPQVIEFNKQRLLTTDQLAEVYGTTVETIRKNFSNNKSKFITGKHFYLLEGIDLKKFKNSVNNVHSVVGKNANQLILYTKQGAARHSKMLGTDKAWDMFDVLEESYFNVKPLEQLTDSYMIDDPVKRAEKWIEEQKERQVLEHKVEELQPKADYYDRIMRNPGLITVSMIAKNYGMATVMFNRKLHELGIQFKQGKTWLLYKKYQNEGYTHVETYEYTTIDGLDKSRPTMKWTQKGHKFLYDVLKENDVLPLIEQNKQLEVS